jgi:flagellar biosynthesis chaperone FliJ
VASVKKLVERRMAEGRAAALRHEQRDADEIAARVAWARRGAGDRTNAS